MIRALTIALALLTAIPAAAQPLKEGERRVELLSRHRGRLERQLAEQARRISRLKAQPRGVSRDFQLKSALRSSQQLATRLTRLQSKLRSVVGQLRVAYDKAIASARARKDRPAAQRLRRRKRALEARIAGRTRPRGRLPARAVSSNPYDSPEDLEEKADLLKDSEDKVRRQLRQLEGRLVRLSRRARLSRHHREADDSPFLENVSRRTRRTRSSSGTLASAGDTSAKRDGKSNSLGNEASDSPGPAPAAPPAAYQGGSQQPGDSASPSAGMDRGAAEPSVSGGGTSGIRSPTASGGNVAITVRDVVDPALLDKLRKVGSRGSLRQRLAELRKATAKLKRVAGKLSTQARSLRARAKKLRKQK